jgi:hypothetical protein
MVKTFRGGMLEHCAQACPGTSVAGGAGTNTASTVRIWLRNCRLRCSRLLKNASGVLFDDRRCHEDHPIGDRACEPHPWVTHSIVMPSRG